MFLLVKTGSVYLSFYTPTQPPWAASFGYPGDF